MAIGIDLKDANDNFDKHYQYNKLMRDYTNALANKRVLEERIKELDRQLRRLYKELQNAS